MPMGIVSDSDFLSELDNGSVSSTTRQSPRIPIISPSDGSTDEKSVSDIPTQIIESESVDDMDLLESTECTGIIEQCNNPGRKSGDVNVPDTLRKIIADTAITEGRSAALKLASSLGISPSSVSAYTDSKTSTSSEKSDESLSQFITNRKKKLGKRALAKLSLALDHITEEKLKDAKPAIVANVAVSMSHIVRNMEVDPEKTGRGDIINKPVFVLYSPPQKSEDKYEVIHSRE